MGAVELPAGEEGIGEEVTEEARAGPDGGPGEIVGLVAEHLDSSTSPGWRRRTSSGPVSGWASDGVSSRSACLESRPELRSRESRSSKVTTSPGSTAATGASSGCQRL